MNTTFAPRAEQRNEFFGLNGQERLDGGSRGGMTVVTGVIIGDDMAAFVAAWQDFLAKWDGEAYELEDTEGTTHPQAVLMEFAGQGRLRQDVEGRFFRPYTARFDHLI